MNVLQLNIAGNEVELKAGNMDSLYRKVKNASGQYIHTAKGRLTQAQFIDRCHKHDISVLSINGKQIDGTPKPTPKPTPEAPKQERAPRVPREDEPSKSEAPKTGKAERSMPKTQGERNEAGRALYELIEGWLPEQSITETQIRDMIAKQLGNFPKTVKVVRQDGTKKDMGIQHYLFEDILNFVSVREHVALVGPAGSGKTYVASQIAKALDLEFSSISVGGMTTKTDFFGYMDAQGNYVRTLFRDAYEHGKLFLLDEMDAGNANVLTMINMALSSDECAFPDGMVKRHPNFVLIAGANTYGTGGNREYVGRNQLDAATLDRFGFIDFGYDEKVELAISPNAEWTKYVQKIRKRANDLKVRHVISPRASLMGGKLLKAGMDVDKVKKYVLWKSLKAEDVKRLDVALTVEEKTRIANG